MSPQLRDAGYDPAARVSVRVAGERDRFRKVWESSASVADAAKALGLTEARARTRAKSLRDRGLPLRLLAAEGRAARAHAKRERFLQVWNAARSGAEAARQLGWSLSYARNTAGRLRRLGMPAKYMRKRTPPHKRSGGTQYP